MIYMHITKTDLKNRKKYMTGDFGGFICIMCGSEVTKDDSISHRGYNLICNDCKTKIEQVIGERIMENVHIVGSKKERIMNSTVYGAVNQPIHGIYCIKCERWTDEECVNCSYYKNGGDENV